MQPPVYSQGATASEWTPSGGIRVFSAKCPLRLLDKSGKQLLPTVLIDGGAAIFSREAARDGLIAVVVFRKSYPTKELNGYLNLGDLKEW